MKHYASYWGFDSEQIRQYLYLYGIHSLVENIGEKEIKNICRYKINIIS